MIPSCETSPTVGLRPKLRLFPEGQTTEPSVSVPTVAAHMFAAAATAEPELDPHGSKLSRYGSRVKPPRALQPLNGALPRKFAHSERFALPRMTAPAARNTIRHHGIRRNDAAYECERSCCRLHFVSSREVALHQDRKISLNLASR